MFGCLITHYTSFFLAAQCIEGFKSDGIVRVTCATTQIKQFQLQTVQISKYFNNIFSKNFFTASSRVKMKEKNIKWTFQDFMIHQGRETTFYAMFMGRWQLLDQNFVPARPRWYRETS